MSGPTTTLHVSIVCSKLYFRRKLGRHSGETTELTLILRILRIIKFHCELAFVHAHYWAWAWSKILRCSTPLPDFLDTQQPPPPPPPHAWAYRNISSNSGMYRMYSKKTGENHSRSRAPYRSSSKHFLRRVSGGVPAHTVCEWPFLTLFRSRDRLATAR